MDVKWWLQSDGDGIFRNKGKFWLARIKEMQKWKKVEITLKNKDNELTGKHESKGKTGIKQEQENESREKYCMINARQ